MSAPAAGASHGAVDPSAVFGVLQPQFRALDRFLRDQLAAFEPEVRAMVAYCLDNSGKRLRPSLVFFSGWPGEDHAPEPLVRLAAVIEMVHLATLVHDDIMDGAVVRRNRATAAREFGANAAVLLGDALFAQALHLAAQFPTTEVCRHVAAATRRVCSGEIMQTLAPEHAERNTAYYRRVIALKTAELFTVSCFLGARLAGADSERAAAFGRFGLHLGTGYQIYDDLADFFGDEARIGKTLGTDLASGKATLPLLLLLERLPADEAAGLRRDLQNRGANDLARRVAQMSEHGVFEDVMAAIRAEIDAATQAIAPWRETPAARFLIRLAELLQSQAAALRGR